MDIIPTLNLFVDTSGTPYYWMVVLIPGESDYEIDSSGPIPQLPSPGEEFHINVNLLPFTDGELSVQIDIGEIPLDAEDGEIHIHLVDQSFVRKGGGIVRADEAQEATKPIGIGD